MATKLQWYIRRGKKCRNNWITRLEYETRIQISGNIYTKHLYQKRLYAKLLQGTFVVVSSIGPTEAY